MAPALELHDEAADIRGDEWPTGACLDDCAFECVVVGKGVRTAGAIDAFRDFIDRYRIPFVSTYMAVDILPEHPLRRGVLGTHGNQEAVDLVAASRKVLVIGARMSVGTAGYEDNFLKGKEVVVVNIDRADFQYRGFAPPVFFEEDALAWLTRYLA